MDGISLAMLLAVCALSGLFVFGIAGGFNGDDTDGDAQG